MGNSRKKLGNKLILFEISMTNNEMMSSVLSNILEWPGRKIFHTGTFDSHARFETRFCQTGSTNKRSLWFDQSQTIIQNKYPCNLMNTKENIFFF